MRSISAEISRSWLLVAGTKPETFSAAEASRADQIILDIEDAVDPKLKPKAREDVANWLEAGGQAWVRINDATSPFWRDDLDRLRGLPGLQGVMLTKVEDGSQVAESNLILGGNTPVIALVESALGIEEARAIASAPGAFRLAFGSGDYRRDTGTSVDNMAMAYPRSRLVVASRIGNLPGPIDGPTVGQNYSMLREQSEVAVALGMTGKLCLQTEQIAVINEQISPTSSDVAWANDFLVDFEAGGRVVRDGSDLPRLGRAEKIMKLARAFGIEPL